jgi:hypothetical protein
MFISSAGQQEFEITTSNSIKLLSGGLNEQHYDI